MALTTVPASLSATALTLTTAAQPNITSVGTLTGLTVSGNIAGTLTTAAQTNITSVGTLSALSVGNITSTGTITSGGNITVGGTNNLIINDSGAAVFGNDSDITIGNSGANGLITAANGDLTLDVAGDIILDADGGDVDLKDGGTTYAHLSKSSNDFFITNPISDGDILLRGNDGGSFITALTLDMSAAGFATFNDGITLKNGMYINNAAGSVTAGYLYNDSDDFIVRSFAQDKDLIFKGNDGGSLITALTLDMSEGGKATFANDIAVADNRGLRLGSDNDSVIYNDGSNLYIKNNTSNQDIIFQGNDDGSTGTTVLTLDMSNGGAATFNSTITAAGITSTGNVFASDIIARNSGGLALQTDEGTKRLFINDDGKVGISEGGVIYASRFSVGKPANHTPGTVFTSSPSSFFSEAALGGTTGNSQKIAIFGGSDASNVSGLAIYRYRRATGTNWTTDGFSLRQEVDSTASIYDYINFAGGNVGIGSANPGSALHIVKGSGAGHNGIRIDNTTSYYGQLNFYTTGGNRRGFVQSAGNGVLELGTDSGSGNLQLYSGGHIALEAASNNRNIGIGVTPDANYKVKVYSGDYYTMKLRAPTYPVLKFEAINQNSGNNGQIGISANNEMNINPDSSTYGISIQSTGAVRMRNQPYVQGRGNASWSATAGSATWNLQPMAANPIVSRDHGNNYSASNKRFTCPVDGVYLVTASWYIYQNAAASAGSQYVHPALAKNGSLNWNGGYLPYTIHGHEINRSGTGSKHYDGVQITFMVYCSATDYLEIKLYSPNSNPQSYEYYHYFSYTLLS